jgi:predicted nuclease of predicted toxin-antitoxin system
VKLLFDENLSERLVRELTSEYPGSSHVRSIGLRGEDDSRIWDYARLNEFAIVSKDTDFRDRSYVDGSPPKVIWLSLGNAGTDAIAALLRGESQRIARFETSEEASFLVVSTVEGVF